MNNESNNNDCTYDVRLKLVVEDHKGNREGFVKKISLPFTPYLGLQVIFEQGKSGNPSGPIISVMWNEWSKCFVCETDAVHSPKEMSDGEYWPLESYVACALSDGWESE